MSDQVQALSCTYSQLREAQTDRFDPQLDEFFTPDEVITYQISNPSYAHVDDHVDAHIDANTAAGLFIYISPKPGAKPPPGWATALAEHNLLWVGAEQSGNDIHVARRVGLALLAPAAASQVAKVDPDKIVLGGFSGGGRVASMMMPAYPQWFSAALYICGANPLFTATEEAIAALGSTPMVFLTGTGDFNLEDTQMAITTFHQAGLSQAKLQVVDGLGHALPEPGPLQVALTHLTA